MRFGAIVSVSSPAGSIASQVAAASATVSASATADAAAIALMHTNSTLATNATPFLAPGVTDAGGVGAPPSYITTLPAYPKVAGSQNPGSFPYNNPPPHWTTNLKWWTGQTLMNVGSPQYYNDPWEYLRSALVDSNMTMFKLWIQWFLAEAGKPATTVYASAQPWADSLQSINLSNCKYIMTSEGPVFLPFSYADLHAIQQTTASYEYGYDEATLAAYLAAWVTQVLPDVSAFPVSTRLDPATIKPYASPYGANYLPAIYRQGTTLLSQIAPYLPVIAIAAGGVLALVLAAGSGVGAAAAAVDTGSTEAATDALSAGADASLTAAADTSVDASLTVLAPVTVTATAIPTTAAITTGLTIAAASGATVAAATPEAATTPETTSDTDTTELPEIDVTSTTIPAESDADIAAIGSGTAAASLAAAVSATPDVSIPSDTSTTPTVPTSGLASLGAALAKLFGGGGSGAAAGESGETGVTGTTGETLGDFFGSLTSAEWLMILAAGAAGLYFIHESRPKRKVSHS